MNKQTKDTIERADKARNFPAATCPASRHALVIGEHLARQQPYALLTDEPDHCGVSILSTVASLWEARAEIERLRAKYARLREAAYEIYWSANWTADQEVDHDAMWDELRDAGALEQEAQPDTKLMPGMDAKIEDWGQ